MSQLELLIEPQDAEVKGLQSFAEAPGCPICADCKKPIGVGEHISWDGRNGKNYHLNCYLQPKRSQRKLTDNTDSATPVRISNQ